MENGNSAADFRAGKAAVLHFLEAQIKKCDKGKANPALAGEILERKLKGRPKRDDSSAQGGPLQACGCVVGRIGSDHVSCRN